MAFPSDEQKKILEHDTDKHARVLAGPGTGKSTTMVALLGKVLESNPNARVRMLTFTRAASAELAEKVHIDSDSVPKPSTIHSFSISILLANLGSGGFPQPLRIADDWEERWVIQQSLARRLGVRVRDLRYLVREMAANWESLGTDNDPDISDAQRKRFLGAWIEHREVFGYTLLAELPFALRRALISHDDLKGLDFDLLLVDEYQDLNACDLDVLKRVSTSAGARIIGAGDDDQSIYAWRNAAPEGIRRFMDDYPGATDYTLSKTVRCGKKVIAWANHVIAGDPDRPTERALLDPVEDSPDGEVALLGFSSDIQEAKGIARLARGLIDTEGLAASEILILTRSDFRGAFSGPIRGELEKLGIECSDTSYVQAILSSDENRLALVHYRLLTNPQDSIAWASLIHLTAGVGRGFVDHIYGLAKSAGKSFANILLNEYMNAFQRAPRSSAKAMTAIRRTLQWLETYALPSDLPKDGWGAWMLEAIADDHSLGVTEGFTTLLSNVAEVSDAVSLDRFLGQLYPIGRDLAQSQSDGIRIMTMGGSKGLTVEATIVAGMEHGNIPRPDSDQSEERRLLYVAMTRSKKYLFLTWTGFRRGPAARAGRVNLARRNYCGFLEAGPVQTQSGVKFLETRFE